jgi:hypothetical protein
VQTPAAGKILKAQVPLKEGARTDCITSINKVVHQLISRNICVVVVIEPTPIHTIAYIHHPATPHNLLRDSNLRGLKAENSYKIGRT